MHEKLNKFTEKMDLKETRASIEQKVRLSLSKEKLDKVNLELEIGIRKTMTSLGFKQDDINLSLRYVEEQSQKLSLSFESDKTKDRAYLAKIILFYLLEIFVLCLINCTLENYHNDSHST